MINFHPNLILLFLNKNISETKKYDILSVRLDSSIEGDYGEKENEISYIYDMKSSLSQLKYMYFHNPIFSKNNLNKNKNIIYKLQK